MQNLSKASRAIVEVTERCFCVQTQLAKCVPACKFKQKVQKNGVEQLGKETFKHRDHTLADNQYEKKEGKM